MWPFLTDPASMAEFVFFIGCVSMGLSHVVQPGMWVDFFGRVHAQGTAGLVGKVLAVELWPAVIIVTFHQVWDGPGIILTLYGWALLLKSVVALLVPATGIRSLAMAQTQGNRGFVAAGLMLMVVGVSSGLALFWF